MEKLFIYLRNSSTKQEEKETEKSQLLSIENYLSGLNVVVLEKFADLAKSGDDPCREQFELMISRLNEVDGIACFDKDRLSRDLFIGFDLMKALIQNHVKIYESRTRSIIDVQNDSEQLTFMIGMWANANEKKKIKARQLSGIIRYKKEHNGKWGRSKNWGKIDGGFNNRNKFIKKYNEFHEKGISKTNIAKFFGMHIQTLYKRLKECELMDAEPKNENNEDNVTDESRPELD